MYISLWILVFTGHNYCDSNPCVHGACHLHHGGYLCTCNYGYKGINCETGMCYVQHIYVDFAGSILRKNLGLFERKSDFDVSTAKVQISL